MRLRVCVCVRACLTMRCDVMLAHSTRAHNAHVRAHTQLIFVPGPAGHQIEGDGTLTHARTHTHTAHTHTAHTHGTRAQLIFVPGPAGHEVEDDGWLLGMVFDAEAQRSSLVARARSFLSCACVVRHARMPHAHTQYTCAALRRGV